MFGARGAFGLRSSIQSIISNAPHITYSNGVVTTETVIKITPLLKKITALPNAVILNGVITNTGGDRLTLEFPGERGLLKDGAAQSVLDVLQQLGETRDTVRRISQTQDILH